jgi:uncharacterized protein (TIGR04255 family)
VPAVGCRVFEQDFALTKMTEKSPAMGGLTDWRPIHEAHAIERAIISVSFFQQLTDMPFNRVIKTARELARELGNFVESPVTQIEVAISPAGATSRAPSTQGLEMVRHSAPKIVADKFSFLKDKITYETRVYTRWKPFFDQAQAVIARMLSHYATTTASPLSDC